MLYVFHVDTGRMMKFDMSLALSSVEVLKENIERVHGLPAKHQILLVSGGEILLPSSLVCSYSAGTDTNPIYMFTTIEIKTNMQPWPSIEQDLTEQVEKCYNLPPTYATVVSRAQVAQQMYDLAREEESICEKLVHEQHLQQQGWSAVVANMEDLTLEFKLRFENFSRCFQNHDERINEYRRCINQFNEDLDRLATIPILPGLMENAEQEFRGFDEFLDNDEVFGSRTRLHISAATSSPSIAPSAGGMGSSKDISAELEQHLSTESESKKHCLTLLQWITAKENQRSLGLLAQDCERGLAIIKSETIAGLMRKVTSLIGQAEQADIKQIKGLEDRLCGLERLMYDLKKKVQDQKELATAFQQNQNRASNLGDASILPDLCASHKSQLMVMLQNQRSIRDIRRRISKAKEELGINLYKRLKFIIHLENAMSEFDNNMLFYHRCLRRIQKHISIIEQIHHAPTIYVTAVTEVVRRRIFSTAFLLWSSDLACDLLNIYNDEIMRRQEFISLFDGHFLNSLFPGMDDMPPAFANDAPSTFDASLPTLTNNDIEVLSSYLPDLTSKIQLPDMTAVIEFFSQRSGNRNRISQSEGKIQTSTGIGIVLHRPIDMHAHLKDGFESETDTEEFEKVGQSPNERQNSSTGAPGTATVSTSTIEQPEMTCAGTSTDVIAMQSIETLTEENLGTTTLEVERLKSLLIQMSQVSRKSLALLRNQLDSLRKSSESEKEEISTEFTKLSQTLDDLKTESETRERELLQRLTVDHELELNDVRKSLLLKDDEIQWLKSDRDSLETNHMEALLHYQREHDDLCNEVIELKDTIKTLQLKLDNFDYEKEKALAECRDRLNHEHKTEIESLRCRFKLMTSMDKSPSDTSLEKIERPDMIEIACHESILQQTRDDFDAEKEQAVQEAIEKERLRWTSGAVTSGGNPDLLKVIEEKDKQLDALREREIIILKENSEFRLKIGSMATSSDDSNSYILSQRVVTLEKERARLMSELNKEKGKRAEMETSVSKMRGSVFGSLTSSPGGFSRKVSSTQTSLRRYISVDSCSKGDVVLIMWNNNHGQYLIAQVSKHLHFLHGDSYSDLGLTVPTETHPPDAHFCIGQVIVKEYCHARKEENRYRVTKGTKFFRVKVSPIEKLDDLGGRMSSTSSRSERRERNESISSSQSVPVSRSTSSQHLIDSFAQTESPTIGRDMVDSGVVEQLRSDSVYKDRTLSATEEDEPITVLTEQCRELIIGEGNERIMEESSQDCATANVLLQLPIESFLSEKDQDDSDEYRSLEAKDDLEFSASVI